MHRRQPHASTPAGAPLATCPVWGPHTHAHLGVGREAVRSPEPGAPGAGGTMARWPPPTLPVLGSCRAAGGLCEEGGRWDGENECLARQPPKQLLQELPVLKVIPIEAHKLKLHGTLETPVYTTSDRRNAMGVGLVFEANLATKNHSSHWVLQGVCLTLNDD